MNVADARISGISMSEADIRDGVGHETTLGEDARPHAGG